jgi:hypothetical protein
MVLLRSRFSAWGALASVLAAAAVSCTTETVVQKAAEGPTTGPACTEDSECPAGTPVCDGAAGLCVKAPAGGEIGRGDGSPGSVVFTTLVAFDATLGPVDVAFHPTRKDEAWVVGNGDNSVYVGTGVSSAAPAWKRYADPARNHFMYKPPAIVMGVGETFATCGDNDDSQNRNGTPSYFMGPALFSTDLSVFATAPTNLGSHLDMLHSTPFCRGIAHVEANWFWVFNAYDNSLDKYNFAVDHGPGMDDHSDGEIYRYAGGKVKGLEGTPSHIFYDASDKFLYVADTGNARIVKLDTTKGTLGEELPRRNEPLVANGFMNGTDVEVVVPPGKVAKPSGLEVREGLIYVTDAETSTFYVFDKTGKEVRKLATGLAAGSLAGFTFDDKGRLVFTDRGGARLVRIDVP